MRRRCNHSSTTTKKLVLLAPADAVGHGHFENVVESQHTYSTLMTSLQRFRGRIYVNEGAVAASALTLDGRHVQKADSDSWHLLSISSSGKVLGCARFHAHSGSAGWSHTGVSRSSLAGDPVWGSHLRKAVEAEIQRATRECRSFVEAGGWALSEELRYTAEGIRLALGAFCWAKLIGGAIALTTATLRHKSAEILKRLGGTKLRTGEVEIPRYFDPAYGCDMEILRFSEDTYATACHDLVLGLTQELREATVITPTCREWRTTRAMHPAVFSKELLAYTA